MKSATRRPVQGDYVGKHQRMIADVLSRAMQGGKWEVECVVPGATKNKIVNVTIEWSNIADRWERVAR